MPKSGKGQKNGLTLYIITELMPELARQGQVYPNGLKDLVPIAMPRYQALPRHEREKYERMANDNRANKPIASAASDTRRDNLGQIIVERVDTREQMRIKRGQDRRELQKLFISLTDADLLEQKFYFIDFQFMILTEENLYYPLEYGLVEWCMLSGITRFEHGFINPGPIPLGYRYKAKEHSEDTHRIPLEDFSEGESNYQKIWMKLERFLCPDFNDNKFPPVYCLDLDYQKVNGCLSWLYDFSGMPLQNHFHLNILEELATMIFAHKNFAITESSVMDLLTTSAYDFEANTKCNKHDEVEAKHCALGCVKKYTFALSDALSDYYGFSLTSNHLPTITAGQVSVQEAGFGSLKGRASDNATSFGARDIRYFPPSKKENETEDEDDDDDINYSDNRNNFRAAAADFLPSNNKMATSTNLDKTMMGKMRDMTFQSQPKTVPTLAGIAADFREQYELTPENNTRRDFEDLGSIGATSQTSSFLPPVSSQFVAPSPVTGRGASDGPDSLATPCRSDQSMIPGVGRGAPTNPGLMSTPQRVGASEGPQLFSPSGRGRAFISSSEYASGYKRPPPGFKVGDKGFPTNPKK